MYAKILPTRTRPTGGSVCDPSDALWFYTKREAERVIEECNLGHIFFAAEHGFHWGERS